MIFEIDSEEAENLIRALSEMRLFIRQSFLSELSDDELETGDFDLEKQNGSTSYVIFLLGSCGNAGNLQLIN